MHYFCIFILAVIDNTTKSYKNNFKMALYIENNCVVAFVSKFAYAHKLRRKLVEKTLHHGSWQFSDY